MRTRLADDAFTQLLGKELTDRAYEFALSGGAWPGCGCCTRPGGGR